MGQGWEGPVASHGWRAHNRAGGARAGARARASVRDENRAGDARARAGLELTTGLVRQG